MRNLFLLLLLTGWSFLGYSSNGKGGDSTFVSEISITPNFINKESGLNYSIYCIKYKKDWILLSINEFDVSLYLVNQKTNETRQGSEFLKQGIEKILLSGFHKKVNKSKEITDIEVSDYYKPTGKGNKVIKHLLLVDDNTQKKKKKFLFF